MKRQDTNPDLAAPPDSDQLESAQTGLTAGAWMKAEQARLLKRVLPWIAGILSIGVAISIRHAVIYAGAWQLWAMTLFQIASIGACMLAWQWNRRGKTHAAGYLVISSLVVVVLAAIMLNKDLIVVFAVIGLLICLLAGVLISSRAGYAFSIGLVLSIVILVALYITDIYRPNWELDASTEITLDLAIFVSSVFLGTLLVSLNRQSTQNALDQLLQRSHELSEANRRLESEIVERKQVEVALRHREAVLQKRSAELEMLRQASLHLTASLELQHLLQLILRYALDLVAYDDAHIFLYDGQELTFSAALWADGVRQICYSNIRPNGLTYTVARSKKRLVIENPRSHPLYQDRPWDGAIVGIPLCAGDQVVGVMNVAFEHPHHFDQAELRILGLLADQAAIAIENANLHQRVQRRIKELTFLNRVGQTLVSSLEPDQVLETVIEQSTHILNAAAASVLLLDPTGQELVFTVVIGTDQARNLRLPAVQGIAGHVLHNNTPLIVHDVSTSPYFYPNIDKTTGFVTRSILAVPLQVRGQVIGVIEAVNKIEGHFDQSDLGLLVAISQSAAIAIENARLYQNIRERMAELERTQAQLVQSARLAAVGKLAEGAAHELNNPLTIVIGFAQLLSESLEPDHPMRADLQTIDQAATRAQAIVRALLDFAAQTSSPRRAPLKIDDLVQGAIKFIHHQAQTLGIEIVENYAPGVKVLGDREQLHQVFLHIAQNAVQAMPHGGKLIVSTARVTRTLDRANERNSVPRQCAAVVFQDNGIGISQADMPRIFDPFFTTRPAGEGMGLGLAISHGIVDRHGGKILVESQVEQGSTFTVLLPATDRGVDR